MFINLKICALRSLDEQDTEINGDQPIFHITETDFNKRLKKSSCLVLGAGHTRGEQDTFSEFDPNYIGIGYGGNDQVPNSPFQSSDFVISSLTDKTLQTLKGALMANRFRQIVFAGHSHYCFTELLDQSYKLKEDGTPFLDFVISKVADGGRIYMKRPYTDGVIKDTCLQDFFLARSFKIIDLSDHERYPLVLQYQSSS